MTKERLSELLKIAIDHIESSEADEADNVFKSLGFTEDELAEIKTLIKFDKEDARNKNMVIDHLCRKGKVVLILNRDGNNYCLSGRVPFKNYPYYIYPWTNSGTLRYSAYVWHSETNNSGNIFAHLDDALDWLVSEE